MLAIAVQVLNKPAQGVEIVPGPQLWKLNDTLVADVNTDKADRLPS
jgi:hypothetical protein